jgi:serine O-acetyltransferase
MSYDLPLGLEPGDYVVVGAATRVLGGVSLGDNGRGDPNSVMLRSVPANTAVAGIPARELHQSKIELPEVLKD